MSVRWNIKDRKTGQSIIVPGPTNHRECDTLRTIIKNCAQMANVRHGEGAHKHSLGAAAHKRARASSTGQMAGVVIL